MISIRVSEAAAFDAYSILLVKGAHGLPVDKETMALIEDIDSALGRITFETVCKSWEFYRLGEFNDQVFDLVSKAARDECKASEVDQANQRRYWAKKALQARFWPEQLLTEVKSQRP